jgi:hypothetical protein
MKNINNNYNNYNAAFSGLKKDKPIMRDKTSKINVLVPATKKFLADAVEKEVPENGSFKKVFLTFDVPETNNQALMIVEQNSKEPKTQRNLLIGVRHKNRDRLTSNLLEVGTKQDILEYLKKEDNTQEIIDSVNHLSEKTDDFYSQL